MPSSEFLAILIVAYRILGTNKKEAEEAMKELANRRINGNLFQYEKFIEEKIIEIRGT